MERHPRGRAPIFCPGARYLSEILDSSQHEITTDPEP